MASRVRRNCTDESEFVRAKSEYFNYLLTADYNISSIDNEFQNVQLLSQETLVRKTGKNHFKVANTPSKIIRKNLRSAVDSSEQLKEILPLGTIKLSSRKDRNLKEMLEPLAPYAHRKDKQLNQLGSCSRCGGERCGLCKRGILAETNKFCNFPLRFKYRILGL